MRRPPVRAGLVSVLLFVVAASWPLAAQEIDSALGVDARVDYRDLVRFGPWDDRNYELTLEDLACLAPNEAEQSDPIPAFYRVELRQLWPDLRREGEPQYPRKALNQFFAEHGGYLVDGRLYRGASRQGDRFVVILGEGVAWPARQDGWVGKALAIEARVSPATRYAESAVAIHPRNPDLVVAASNYLQSGGVAMHYSTDGGATWLQTGLPDSHTLCDPTVEWSADGRYGYAASLDDQWQWGICTVCFFRSDDYGVSWGGLANEPPGGDARRELSTSYKSDKEYLHVDRAAGSPGRDNIYATWHDNNVMMYARSTDFGNTWTAGVGMNPGGFQGIGSDITSDKDGSVYYIWPVAKPGAWEKRIVLRKSTDEGVTWQPAPPWTEYPPTIALTNARFDFPIPAAETRMPFINVSADADLTNGPYANRLYVAWADTVDPETDPPDPAGNHAHIQVARSTDGGATWTVSTPHETADQLTVDRFNPWLAVAPDGSVHVVFYDTRRDPARTSVDLFHNFSTDGGVTWGTPERLTSVQSPNIADSFEFGDYNGMSAVLGQVLGIYTDNRDETGGTAESVDVYVAGTPLASWIFGDGFESGDTGQWSATVP